METIEWLLTVGKPWTRYRTTVDLLNKPESSTQAQSTRAKMLAHPKIKALVEAAAGWPGYALKRHNDAAHPIYKFSTLADFGLKFDDPGMLEGLQAVMLRQGPQGAFQSPILVPKAFGGSGKELWTWLLCDAPTLLYTLLAMGLDDDTAVKKATEHLVSLVDENGYRCVAAPELGRFRGPGRKADPCPIANLYALKALSLVPELVNSPATRLATEVLLRHWEKRNERKIYLFGIGGDYHKIKYPMIWYDILHVADVLSRFPFLHQDPRFQEILAALDGLAGDDGCYTASSMYRAWKGWSFADKKAPSPWLTFLVLRIRMRVGPTHRC
jgi:hypothetical protein